MIERDGVSAPVLAIVPARGGSKGVPRKNVRPLGGVPLVARSIATARGSRFVDEVIVSTDDDEIADVSARWGGTVVRRPGELAGDTASSEAALLHVLETRRAAGWTPQGVLVFLQCTSPFTTTDDIDGTLQAMVGQRADTCLAVAPFFHFVWKHDANGSSVGINHDKSVRPRRQDREPQFLETGAVYAMDIPGFLHHRHRFFGRTAMHVMAASRSLEIDDPVDFDVAEALLAAGTPG